MEITKVFGNDIPQKKFDAWIQQFDEEEQPFIITLIENFTYVSFAKLQEFVVELHSTIMEYCESVDELLFIPVGYVAKSGSAIAYFYKKENQLRENLFLPYSDIGKSDISEKKVIVFLDDFIGTGHQAMNIWKNLESRLSETNLQKRFVYSTLIGYEEGKSNLEKNSGFQVITQLSLSEQNIPFNPRSNIFGDEESRGKAEEILRKYGERLYSKYPLGYGDSGGLVGFFYSTPNNTLPIFWSNSNNWTPLLSRGDDFRDPMYLVGPSLDVPENLTIPDFENTIVDEIKLEKYDIDPEILILLLHELRTTHNSLIIAPILKSLDLSASVVKSLIQLLNKLKNAIHERESVTSGLFIADSDTLNSIEYYLLGRDLMLHDEERVLELAYQSNGYDSALAISTEGQVIGAFSYGEKLHPTKFIPSNLKKAAGFSSQKNGLLFVFHGNDRANILWKGQKLLTYKGATWYLTPSQLAQLISKLAIDHSIEELQLERLIEIAVEMTIINEGALLTIGDHESVLKNSAKKEEDYFRLGKVTLTKNSTPQLIKILSQDGATIIANDGTIVQHMTTLRPNAEIKVEQEVGKGTKHQTAKVISAITEAVTVAVSVDGNFSIYSKGEKLLRISG